MNLKVVICAVVLCSSAPADAQVTRVSGSESSVITLPSGTVTPSGRNVVHGAGILANAGGSGASYDTSVSITPTTVSFEAGNAVSGPSVAARSSTSVDIVLTNRADAVVSSFLHSSIIPAGMGLYLADVTSGCGGNVYTGCPQSLSGLTFSDLSASGDSRELPVAYSGFDFRIISEGVTLYQVKGSMNLTLDPSKGAIVNTSVANAASLLNGFTQVTPLNSQSAMGFAWDTTDFVIPLGALGIGQSLKLTYLTTVETYSRTACINSSTCLVAYSGFGDPVGRGGGTSFARFTAAGPSSSIQRINFSPAVFNTPTFNRGILTFRPGRVGSAVPEPATWAMMLAGFSLLGAAVRRRRTVPTSR
jgi:PEP-CTERM motif